MGAFPEAPGRKKFSIVAIDYFTKWVEAEALTGITHQQVQHFLWKNIICRFGIPKVLVSDNGWQFQAKPFKEFCSSLGICQHFSSVDHPKSNGQTEVTNRTILQGIKKRLYAVKGKWVEELPSVLWSYRTTYKTATGDTPFNLTYGTEALIPVEIGMPGFRVHNFNEETNEEGLKVNLDLVEEVRDQAYFKMQVDKRRVARFFNRQVWGRQFKERDW